MTQSFLQQPCIRFTNLYVTNLASECGLSNSIVASLFFFFSIFMYERDASISDSKVLVSDLNAFFSIFYILFLRIVHMFECLSIIIYYI